MSTVFKILLVDDDSDDQLLFAEALKDLTSTVHCDTASNGLEAFSYLDGAKITPNIIFLDLNMPIMNGLQFLRKRQELSRHLNIPIIIFTTSNSPVDIEMTRKLGASLFITKPSDFKELKARIRDVLNLNFNTTPLPISYKL